jgi:Zn-dependent protease with chaperone function
VTLLGQFLLYNLLPSLIIGFLLWLVVVAAFTILPIRRATLRLSLLAIPLAKSILILLGIGLIFRWPRPLLADWHERALPVETVLPFLLVWAGAIFLIYQLLIRNARQRMLRKAQPPPERLIRLLDEVLLTYRQIASGSCFNGLECRTTRVPRPRLLISDDLNSPVALTSGGEATVIFPTGLISELDDHEIRGALAHELTHFGLRWSGWCSVGLLRNMAVVSPVAGLVVTNINREEEKAADEMAVKVMGQPEAYTDMLLKSYRYALNHARPIEGKLQLLPRLLGYKPMLTERVEGLLHPSPAPVHRSLQYVLTCILWVGLSIVLFTV